MSGIQNEIKRHGDAGEHLRFAVPSDKLSDVEERELALAWKNDRCAAARERLITSHLWLASTLARRYSHRGTPLDELIAEAHVGLIEAVENFDPDRGARFSTYAVYWIRHSLASVFIRAASGPRLSRQERADLLALENARASCLGTSGTQPSVTELAEVLNWTVDRVRAAELMAISRVRPRSLGASPDAATLAAVRAADTASDNDGGTELLDRLLTSLNDVERQIVERHFGLNGFEAKPITDVAATLRLSPRATRTRFDVAMKKLTRLGRSSQQRGLVAQSARRAG
ncbi:MAG: sigma-70 family RNA polymerase sigma factor [Phycisphaerales bacterium]|jgi:RNA polymerase sigma factor (sigma-70 family)